MRAIFYSFQKENDLRSIIVTDDSAKHLIVVRIRVNEEILVLNGCGQKALTKVMVIAKNYIELIVLSVEDAKPTHKINLAIANPKKEAFEDILKIAVELGIQNIYPLTSKYSQYSYIYNDRIQRILESALIQSNNPFLPAIHPQAELLDYLESFDTPLYFFNSRQNNCGKPEKISKAQTILIGPEGGFSLTEEDLILSKHNVFSIHLPTPILRAPTAVASSIGYLLSLS